MFNFRDLLYELRLSLDRQDVPGLLKVVDINGQRDTTKTWDSKEEEGAVDIRYTAGLHQFSVLCARHFVGLFAPCSVYIVGLLSQ